MTAVVAHSAEQEGTAILDGGTALEFLVGFSTGLAHIEPHIAILGILSFEALQEVAMHGSKELFRRQSGESLANRIVDGLALVTGVYLGHYVRAAADARQFVANPALSPQSVPV